MAKILGMVGGLPVQTATPTKVVKKVAAAAPGPYDALYRKVLSSIQTPAQITATANAQALATERAQLAAQKAISDQTIAQYNNQATRAQGFAAAIAASEGNQGDAAMSRYSDAASRLTGIGAGLTGAVGAGYQDAVDRTKAAVAQLTGGQGVTSAPDASAITNAAQYAGVTIPATTLQQGAVNAARMASNDEAARAQNIAHIGQNYSAQADQSISQAASDARALIAKRPATIADLVTQLTANRQTGITNLGNVLQARTNYRTAEQNRQDKLKQQAITNTLNTQAAARADRQIDITESGIDMQQRIQIAQLTGRDPLTGQATFTREQWNAQTDAAKKSYAAAQSSQLGYQVDWKTGLAKVATDANGNQHVVPNAGFRLDPKNPYAVLPIFKPGAAGSSKGVAAFGGLTAAQWDDKVTDAKADLEKWTTVPEGQRSWVSPVVDNNTGEILREGYWSDPSPTSAPKVTYQQALKRIAGTGASLAWKQQALQLVNGYYDEGEGGRPYETKASATAAAQEGAQAAFAAHVPYQKALKALRANSSILPFAIGKRWLDVVYGINPRTGRAGPGGPVGTAGGPVGPVGAEPAATGTKATDNPFAIKPDPNNPFAIKPNPNSPFAIRPTNTGLGI